MRTPSVFIAEEIMPYLRARVAERLYHEGFKQVRIADYLGITQAMVSKYLAGRYRKPLREIAERLDSIADEVVRLILFGGGRDEAIVLVTRRLFDLFESGFLCRFYSEYSGLDEETCRSLFVRGGGRAEILEEMNRAISHLSHLRGFPSLIPEVRSNLACALPSPSVKEDVAAVPGRITSAKGRIFALPPEFGASSFTAGILLRLSEWNPRIRSVMNIRYGPDVEDALKRAGFSFARVKTGGLSEEEAIPKIVRPFEDGTYDAVIDEGGHGVEPLVYIFGRDPLEVVEKIERLISALGVLE
ncbi:thiamine-phosphate synthase family protein [Thermococcus sp.]|uniref:thiamine-phosphate synthase family protein n=1 Tax=Thermococcus sp. TaxID=35749 RepID=UPI00262B55CF|nr:thiamine-phosphate synthase family protein [Thermococcus sp.]